ncbi:MAG: hypothetical protein K940chlam9_01624 [Chlamydiae bacterium]|nr:hypothetical protein [Chlamydiota bacterium]
MSQFPPPGYDDETVVPQKQLKLFLDHFVDRLEVVQSLFQEQVPKEIVPSHELERELSELHASAESLGEEYLFLVERLIRDYTHFKQEPDQEKLDRLFGDVKSLELLLV